MKTLTKLEDLQIVKFANATRIELTNTIDRPVQVGLEIEEKKFAPIEYTLEINKVTTTYFSKYDLRNLKAFSNFYGYWFDEKRKTMSMNGNIYDILKVKNNLYIKDRKTKNVDNLNKHFKLAKVLNTTKIFKSIYNTNTRNLNKL